MLQHLLEQKVAWEEERALLKAAAGSPAARRRSSDVVAELAALRVENASLQQALQNQWRGNDLQLHTKARNS